MVEYLVEWEGYEGETTWEPESNFMNNVLVVNFEQKRLQEEKRRRIECAHEAQRQQSLLLQLQILQQQPCNTFKLITGLDETCFAGIH